MAEQKTGGYCRECNCNVTIYRKGTNHVLQLLLSIVTCGLWLPLWIMNSIQMGGWRCNDCGSKKVGSRRKKVA